MNILLVHHVQLRIKVIMQRAELHCYYAVRDNSPTQQSTTHQWRPIIGIISSPFAELRCLRWKKIIIIYTRGRKYCFLLCFVIIVRIADVIVIVTGFVFHCWDWCSNSDVTLYLIVTCIVIASRIFIVIMFVIETSIVNIARIFIKILLYL